MQAEPVRSVQVGPLQVTLATGERGELLHLLAAPPEVRMRLKSVTALPTMGGEMIMGGFRQTVLEPVRGRTLAARVTELAEPEVCLAVLAAAEALFALAAEGARLREGSVTLGSLVERADGRWYFDLVGAVLHGTDGEGGAAGPGVHLVSLVQALRGQPHLARAPRLRRLALYLAEVAEPEMLTLKGLMQSASKSARSPWPIVAGAGALFFMLVLAGAYFTGEVVNRVVWAERTDSVVADGGYTVHEGAPFLIPPTAQKESASPNALLIHPMPEQKAESAPAPTPADTRATTGPSAAVPSAPAPTPTPAPAPAPTPAPDPARPLGPVDVVILHSGGVAILHGWSGQPTTWVALDDLVGFLGAQQTILPSGRRQLSWQFGQVGIATVIELEMTDTNGIRYVPLTPGLQASMRLHARGWDAGAVYFDREQPV